MPEAEVVTEEAEVVESPEVEAAGEATVQPAPTEGSQAAAAPAAESPAPTFSQADLDAAVAKATAALEAKWTPKLQESAQNAHVLKALQAVTERLEGKSPADPNALPEGFDALPEPLQKHLLAQGETLRKLQEQQGFISRQTVERTIDDVVHDFREDETTGKMFQSLEADIAAEISGNRTLQQWVREDPKAAIDTLFAKHARGKAAQVAAQQAASRAVAAVQASSKPAQVSTARAVVPAVAADLDGDAAFEAAWKIHGAKILQEQGA